MKLKVETDALRTLCAAFSRVVPSSNKASRPVLTSLLFQATETGVAVFGTDLSTLLVMNLAAEIEKDGSACIGYKWLNRFASRANGISKIQADERETRLSCGGVRVRAGSDDPRVFPMPGKPPSEGSVELSASVFHEVTSRVERAVSKDLTRPTMTVLWIEVDDGVLVAKATDGHRMSIAKAEHEGSLMVPVTPTALSVVRSVMPKGDISIVETDRMVVFRGQGATVVSTRIDGVFPAFPPGFDQVGDVTFSVEVQALAAALRFVRGFSDKERCFKTKLHLEGDELVVSSGVDAESRDVVPVSGFSGEPMEWFMDAKIVLDVLGSAATPSVEVEMLNPLHPMKVVERTDTTTAIHIVMPQRA